MLKIIMPTIMLIPLTWHSNSKAVWINTTAHSLMISIMGLPLINQFADNSLNMSLMFFSDALSTPLLSLTLWFLPVMIIASQFHLTNETPLQQKLYLTMLILLQIFLIMTFTATELIMFYILFEATLLSTLILITRWGTQTERLNAGLYFQFYTPVGSLPLLITLLHLQSSIESNPSPSPSPKNPNPNP